MSHRTDRVRIVVLLKRKPTLSKEEFHKHWTETHGPLFSSLDVVKRNLLKYEQAHINDPVLQQIMQMIPGAPTADWDGMAIFEAESYAKVFEVFQSEEYSKVIIPDDEKFVDRANWQMLPFDLNTVVDK
ncbi:hypothetical protein DFH08DRAFT_838454 [Mycena albidolilacea]|uniref:EthD domain-containing protein n=1 Tax=Mycena albidolilacea TaxID=1033008 RepID=A0AAD7AP23_9AGAR|nr:hypothetical protein DFH08DRAFT_838454 [Mycena albidolilacea]